MNITTTAQGIELTPEIKAYIDKRASSFTKLVQGHEDETLVHFIVERTTNHHRSGEIFRTDITLSVSGNDLFASATNEDIMASIDEAKNNMLRELRKSKGKKEALWKRGAVKIKRALKGLRLSR